MANNHEYPFIGPWTFIPVNGFQVQQGKPEPDSMRFKAQLSHGQIGGEPGWHVQFLPEDYEVNKRRIKDTLALSTQAARDSYLGFESRSHLVWIYFREEQGFLDFLATEEQRFPGQWSRQYAEVRVEWTNRRPQVDEWKAPPNWNEPL